MSREQPNNHPTTPPWTPPALPSALPGGLGAMPAPTGAGTRRVGHGDTSPTRGTAPSPFVARGGSEIFEVPLIPNHPLISKAGPSGCLWPSSCFPHPPCPPRLVSRSGRSHRSILGCSEGPSPLPTHPPPCPKSHRDQPQHPAAGGGTPARAAAPKGAAAEPPQDHPQPRRCLVRYPSEESRSSRGVERHLCEAARSLPTPRNNKKKVIKGQK